MRVIDAHQHFWDLATPGHEWPTPAQAAIHRNFGPADLLQEAAAVPLAGTILVQSQPSDTDTDWMLALADVTPWVLGVVGWVDLAAPGAAARVAALAGHGKLRGLRPMLQSIADSAWILGDALTPALEAMLAHGLRFDALVQPRHLPILEAFARRWPDLPIVIDHAAKPFAARNELDPWRDDMARLADRGLWCKLSGLRTEQAAHQDAEALAPYVEHLARCFGDRLLWGSDWPVLHLAGDRYADWLTVAQRLAAAAGLAPQRLFVDAARAFYGV